MEPVISALITLILGTIFGGWLQKVLYMPKVKIEFGNNGAFEHDGGFYASVTVTNKGLTAATDCIGSITFYGLKKEDVLSEEDVYERENLPTKVDEQLLVAENFRELDRAPLCWAHIGNPDKLTINPEMKTLLDVFKAVLNENTNTWYLAIPTEVGWKKLRARLKDGNYRGRILVSPANGKPCTKDFEIVASNTASNDKPRLIIK